MMDLVCLVADKNMEAAMQGILGRPQALATRALTYEIVVHPRRDPGCFHEAPEFLVGYRERATHALVLLDLAWEGAPASTGDALEQPLRDALVQRLGDGWAEPVVIDPELEVWVFSDSPHVASALGWGGRTPELRSALDAAGKWPRAASKPTDPKDAVEHALRQVRKPRSSAIYRDLATRVSLDRCEDRAFRRMRGLLRQWFPLAPAPGA